MYAICKNLINETSSMRSLPISHGSIQLSLSEGSNWKLPTTIAWFKGSNKLIFKRIFKSFKVL